MAEGDKEDIDLAVNAARQAFDHGPWPRMSGYVRVSSFLSNQLIRLFHQNCQKFCLSIF